jgi:hypothetical protein
MGLGICKSDEGCWIYDSCCMRPVQTEAFHDEQEAEDFMLFASARGIRIASASAEVLDKLQDEVRALPVCEDCEERIVVPSDERPTELCSSCELDERPSRGTKAKELAPLLQASLAMLRGGRPVPR